ncbi:hypothetical protein PYW07_011653 [Mythimna separata]|uniref:Cilia- and flagella-associated protein 263 n=1 Tax=Mythimna separata TaxID=271217 RepID=A0AAD7Y709_MYTSE|nr:hypothetical protein PYW07_011653 [Mythimna separata]
MVYGPGSSMFDVESTSVYTLDVLTDAELVRSVENLKKQVRNLHLENEVLEASIMRLQPSLMTNVYSTLDIAIKRTQSVLQAQRTDSRTTLGSARSLASRTGTSDHSHFYLAAKSKSVLQRKMESSIRAAQSTIKLSKSIMGVSGPKINVEEKLELVHAVTEKEEKDLQNYKKFAKKQHDYLDAQLEEIEIRTNDIEKWTETFEEEVIIEGVEEMTRRIPAETWIRFLAEQGKKIDRQIDKLRIRLSTTNVHHRKLRDAIKIKKDLASRIVPVDFEVKAIEIKAALEKIDETNTQLMELKATTGDANLNLTRYKYELMHITNYLQKVIKLKDVRERQTVKMEAETAVLAAQVVSLEQRLDKIKKTREKYLVPDIQDYVIVKSKISDLQHSIKRLTTSLSIKQFALSNFRKEKRKSDALLSMECLKSAELDSSELPSPITDSNNMIRCTETCAVKHICNPLET